MVNNFTTLIFSNLLPPGHVYRKQLIAGSEILGQEYRFYALVLRYKDLLSEY